VATIFILLAGIQTPRCITNFVSFFHSLRCSTHQNFSNEYFRKSANLYPPTVTCNFNFFASSGEQTNTTLRRCVDDHLHWLLPTQHILSPCDQCLSLG
jgi:hypothetical protein